MVSILIKNFPRGADDYFVMNIVPRCLAARFSGILDDRRAGLMDAFLRRRFGATLRELVDAARRCIRTSWVGDSCIVGIDGNAKLPDSDCTVECAMRAVDCGADGLRATHAFRAAFAYVKSHIDAMYKLRLAEGSMMKNGDKLLR